MTQNLGLLSVGKLPKPMKIKCLERSVISTDLPRDVMLGKFLLTALARTLLVEEFSRSQSWVCYQSIASRRGEIWVVDNNGILERYGNNSRAEMGALIFNLLVLGLAPSTIGWNPWCRPYLSEFDFAFWESTFSYYSAPSLSTAIRFFKAAA